MLDLYDELTRLIAALDEQGVEYALCGGLAMAVWGFPRATVDIDVLIEPASLDATEATAESLGYPFTAQLVTRTSKIGRNGGDVLMLDMMLVTPAIADVWATRTRVQWEKGSIAVASPEGLVTLNSYRSTGMDLDGIERLQADGMTADMSPKAITTRLRRVSQLRRLCLSLMKAKPREASAHSKS